MWIENQRVEVMLLTTFLVVKVDLSFGGVERKLCRLGEVEPGHENYW